MDGFKENFWFSKLPRMKRFNPQAKQFQKEPMVLLHQHKVFSFKDMVRYI